MTVTTDDPMVLRTHLKVLFQPALVALLCLAGMVAAFIMVPRWTDVGWAPVATSGAFLLAGLLFTGIPVLAWWCSVYTMNAQMVSARSGILYKVTREIPMRRVTQVNIEQGILDRIFGCGTLILADASNNTSNAFGGAGVTSAIRLDDVPNVKQVHEYLKQLVYAEQVGADGA